MFRAQQISFYQNKRLIISAFDKTFYKEKVYGLIGLNGSGKSTLLKIFAGILDSTSGNLFWEEKDLQYFDRFERSQLITLIPQNTHTTFDYSVSEIVGMGAFLNKNFNNKEHCIEESLKLVQAEHLAARSITELSCGERQRVYIARALAVGSEVLLLDEPTSFLDNLHKKLIWNLIQELSRDKIVIISTHDLHVASNYCHEGILLSTEGYPCICGDFDKISKSLIY